MNDRTTDANAARSPHQSLVRILAEHFDALAGSGLPKHLRLRAAVLDAIEDGSLRPGDQIPPEQELSAGLAISLGTVQRSLGRLALEGTLLREHGRGTFVARAQRSVDEVWQLRFHAPDGRGPLPVYSDIVDQRVLRRPGPWSTALGPDPKGYLQIARLFSVDGAFPCYSRFIVGMTRFAGLRRARKESRASLNLKRILAEEFNAPTLSVTQQVRAARFSPAVCDYLALEPGTTGLVLEVVGLSYGSEPVSFHVVWVPPTEHRLDMSYESGATPVPVETRRRAVG